MYVAKGIDTAANTKKPISPIISPSLIFPFFRKIEDLFCPEIKVNTTIGIATRTALNSIDRAIPLIGEAFRSRRALAACRLMVKEAIKERIKPPIFLKALVFN